MHDRKLGHLLIYCQRFLASRTSRPLSKRQRGHAWQQQQQQRQQQRG
jgi:hypothetical protein